MVNFPSSERTNHSNSQMSRNEDASGAQGVNRVKSELVAETARKFGEVRLQLAGTSMFPCLMPGDIVTVRRCGVEDFRPGEIAKYIRDGRLFAHRVVGVEDGRLITRGDTLRKDDAPVHAEEIVGKVVSVLRGGTTFTPRIAPSRGERALANMARHSNLALRILYFLLKTRPTPLEQTALCQN